MKTSDEKRRKIVLVTGGAGFIGSHLCEYLIKDGHTVISLDNYFTGTSENHISGVIYREGHTKDIEDHISEYPDIVYHLGEYARVEKSFEDIEVVWDANTTGTFSVLEFCRKRGAKIVYAGSSTKFADSGAGSKQSPYAWTKASNTELVQNYGKWFGVPYVITYFYNVYGGRERGAGQYATVVGIFKKQYRECEPLTVVSPGTQTRNFTHIEDTISGLVLAGERGNGDGYAIGSNVKKSVLEVAKYFADEILLLPERKGNRQTSDVDSSKIRALGWNPRHSLEEDILLFKGQNIQKEKSRPTPRVLVFSTTFHPVTGPAEDALIELMKNMPGVHFDIITTLFLQGASRADGPVQNATIYRIGFGNKFDKFLLPFWGVKRAQKLVQKNEYIFFWSIMASYAALAAIFLKIFSKRPLLITLADQRFQNVVWYKRFFLRVILRGGDQISATNMRQERGAAEHYQSIKTSSSLGSGDAFANAIRFAYSSIIQKNQKVN